MTSRAMSMATAGLLLSGALVATAAPAAAHHKPGHSGGPGSNCPNPQDKYPPGQQCQPRAAVSDSTTTRSQSVRWYSEGYAPNAPIALTLESTPVPLGTTTADSFTFAERMVTIPRDAAVGSHHVVSQGRGADGRPLTLRVPITVSADGTSVVNLPNTGPGGSGPTGNGGASGHAGASGNRLGLPRTGTDVALTALVGALLAGSGTAAVVAGRRRRAATA